MNSWEMKTSPSNIFSLSPTEPLPTPPPSRFFFFFRSQIHEWSCYHSLWNRALYDVIIGHLAGWCMSSYLDHITPCLCGRSDRKWASVNGGLTIIMISYAASSSRLISESGCLQMNGYDFLFYFFAHPQLIFCAAVLRHKNSTSTFYLGHLCPFTPRLLLAIFLVIEFPIDRAPSARL